MIEFDYRREKLHSGEIIYRPIAKVYLLRNASEWIAEYFYIDSGADYTLIPFQMGRFLGLDKVDLKVKNISGIGGKIEVRLGIIPMKIGEYQFDCTIGWSGIESVPFLLGREDVFEHFEIIFRQKERKVVFN